MICSIRSSAVAHAFDVALDAANRLIRLFLNLLNKNGPMSIHVVAEEKI